MTDGQKNGDSAMQCGACVRARARARVCVGWRGRLEERVSRVRISRAHLTHLNTNGHEFYTMLVQYGFQLTDLLTPVPAQFSPKPKGP